MTDAIRTPDELLQGLPDFPFTPHYREVDRLRLAHLDEGDGALGTVCIYEATSPEAIRKHASCADLPVDEIIAVADTVIVRPDPVSSPTA